MKRLIYFAFLVYPMLIIAGCGGGGSDGGTTTAATTGVSSGTITGFGSVFVNGVRFNTDNAEIFHGDDQLNDVTELSKGMLVTVEGDLSQAIARRVRFEEDVKGPVDSVDALNRTLSVMGQTVITVEGTVFNNTTLGAINSGDILEISGYRNNDDDLKATFVELKAVDNVNKYKVIGRVRALNTTSQTFNIDNLAVDYSAADINDLAGGLPQEGQLVEVKDENKAYVANSKSLSATKVEPFNRLGDGPFDRNRLEIEGMVTEIVVPQQKFRMAGFTVNILNITEFQYGTVNDLGVGSIVQVKAALNSNQELDATRITFKRNIARITASVDVGGVDVANNQLTAIGILVQLTNGTQMEDKRDNQDPLTIANIQEGDYLEIRGFQGSDGKFIATRLERDDQDQKVEIRGPATEPDPAALSVKILGIRVTADPDTTNFESFSGKLVSPEQFFAAITPGLTVVEAKWDPFSDTSAAPKELELEDEFSNNKLEDDDMSDDNSNDVGEDR